MIGTVQPSVVLTAYKVNLELAIMLLLFLS